MATAQADTAVRNYLTALRDPSSLRDESGLDQLRKEYESTTDLLDRLKLRQDIMSVENPSLEHYEDEFVVHAKEWAQGQGVTAQAFAEEGVPADVLRKAGFSVGGRGGRGRASGGRTTTRRSRVTSEQVRAAIPKGSFTIAQLQDRSGASPQVVRQVVKDEVAAGRVTDAGTDPKHTGPGRAPTLYKR